MILDEQKPLSEDYYFWLNEITKNKKIHSIDKIKYALEVIDPVILKDQANKKISFAAAKLIADLNYDEDTISAAILMYLPNPLKHKESDNIGKDIIKLVSGISMMGVIDKLSNKSSKYKIQLTNIHKMLIAMVNDPRVIIIKLAEQYCKLTYNPVKTSTHLELAKTSMDIYAPLANKLGMGNLKLRLEDAAFNILQSTEYKKISRSVKAHTNERDRLIALIIRKIEDEFKKIPLDKYNVCGRAKHIHSIYRKMQKKNIEVDQIYDSIAIRVLVPTIENCYEVLSIVHTLWENIPEEFDDYIIKPKDNGYRSLHTAVSNHKHQFEIQIRTFQMHEEAEYGLAAHWLYKSSDKNTKIEDHKTKWLRNILEWRDGLSSTHLQNDNIVDDRIYVFTPLGDVIDLPNDSTPIDFAYAIHTDVGHKCKGAKLQNKIVPLNYKLKTGDQLTILTQNELSPSRDWLISSNDYVKTAKAKIKITQWFNQYDVEMLKDLGKSNFDKITKKLHLQNVNLDKLSQNLNYKKPDDFLIAIGRGEIKLNSILQPDIKKIQPFSQNKISNGKTSTNEVHIHGIGPVISKLAKCCLPKNTDNIVGYISQSRGILIHKINCSNILRKKGQQINKLLHVYWRNGDIKQKFFFIEILALNKNEVINDIREIILKYNFNILSFDTNLQPDNNILINICLGSKDLTKTLWNTPKSIIESNKCVISLISNI